MADLHLTKRNLAEVRRSASWASRVVLEPTQRAQVERYLNPPADTPYALEYAFYLLGNVEGKTVLDLGCGAGECIVPLVERGARVIGIDISTDLIALARRRLKEAGVKASVTPGDAYNTGLPHESVDVVFCKALIHHLEIKPVRDEIWRILRTGGAVILKEPIRFSTVYAWLRRLLPPHEHISEYEHPLTREEFSMMTQPFRVEGTRYFRLPLVPLISRVMPSKGDAALRASNWISTRWGRSQHFASVVVTKLMKQQVPSG